MNEMIKNNPGISIIIPFYNEREGIVDCCSTISDYCKTLFFPVELIFVDDGSTDGTASIIEGYQFNESLLVRLIRLSKNYGSQLAIRAGIKEALYDICTWIGADLQDPLELIQQGYERIVSGYDIVCIEKKSNNVSLLSRFFSSVFSHLIKKYAVERYSQSGIDSVVFSGQIKDILNQNIEANSEIVLQILDMGFDITTISMDFNERKHGHSKWTLSKKIKLFIDSFISFSFAPIRFVSLMGIAMMMVGLVIGVVTVVSRLFGGAIPEGYATIVSLIAVGFGMTNVSIGIVAEYLWRTLDVARNRPSFIIKEIKTVSKNDER